MSKLKLAAPWTIYYRQLQALFKKDPEIKVLFDEDKPAVKLLVNNDDKAAALMSLLPEQKIFGNIVLKVLIVPANGEMIFPSTPPLPSPKFFNTLFTGNDALSFIQSVDLMTNTATFVVFKKEVVQFFNDDMSDIHGVCSTLYQDLAKEIFADTVPGVYFCTDIDDKSLGKPLGEWP